MEINKGFVYIMASKRNGTLHIGVTNNLIPACSGTHIRNK